MMTYEDIKPYDDDATMLALRRIADAPELTAIARFLYGDAPEHVRELRERLLNARGIYDFQANIMARVIRLILERSSTALTVEGIENLDDKRSHILLSNHRDIILDPAIIQLALFDRNIRTTEIAVGDNLIASKLIEDIFRSNRMIKVRRGGTPREKYESSTVLSSYLREKVASGEASVWIAQRNGRSKDGRDGTEQGVLKMLEMSGSGDFVKDFLELSILPISISYQYEPCDFLKARELYISRREKYVKQPGEDTISILTGVSQDKGDISFYFSPCIREDELESCAGYQKNDRFKALAALIDERILSHYRLWDTNYIAYDLLNSCSSHSDRYTPQSKAAFEEYMEKGLSGLLRRDPKFDKAELREIFLSIYAAAIR